jgi:hypothetical protein
MLSQLNSESCSCKSTHGICYGQPLVPHSACAGPLLHTPALGFEDRLTGTIRTKWVGNPDSRTVRASRILRFLALAQGMLFSGISAVARLLKGLERCL